MRKNIQNKYLILLLLVVMVVACKSKKATIKETDSNKPEISGSKVKVEDILAKETQYQTFTTKAKANIALDGKSHDVTLNIRNKKGEIIWASVTYIAGIEVARVLITPDSVKLLNRISSEYTVKPFSFIHRYTSPEIDFKALEAMLLGNPLLFTLEKTTSISKENNSFLIKGTSRGLNYQNIYSQSLKPQAVELQNIPQKQELKIDYNNYATVAGKALPLKLLIASVINTKSISLNLEYQNPQFDINQDYPFNAPKRFTLIE